MTDTTDRIKHEWAAKAAGISIGYQKWADETWTYFDRGRRGHPVWNPRHDNNDAFRLAARLKIQVAFGTFKDNVASAYKFGAPAVEVENTDIEAAAREAIFLMAVDIGKGKK